jgi:hypothetical protein
VYIVKLFIQTMNGRVIEHTKVNEDGGLTINLHHSHHR